jgi:eukaryotic-like serine/threonine-protein kinase
MHERTYEPGEVIPGTIYQVRRVIGAGGMGTVYDVEDTTIGKRYVVKTLHPRLGDREDLARRMQNEARTLARLHHPNIVEIFTAGMTADDLRLPFYVMERLRGKSLRMVLEEGGKLEISRAYGIGIDLLDALDHAHDKGVVHRDVKPDNVFLHQAAGVTVTKLLDFGIVSLLDAGEAETAGRFLGTLRYAAPEQLRGDKPTPKMDVYAAALVLYELLAGRGPFDDLGDSHRISTAHLHKTPPPLSKFVAVPSELDALLMAALAKNPEERPKDAFSFATVLRNFKRSQQQMTPRSEPTVPGPSTARGVDVSAPTPEAPIDARGPSPPPDDVRSPVTPHRAPTRLPRTTIVGMSPPTLGATTGAPRSAIGTPPAEAVDRLAPTRSIVPDAMRAPGLGTDILTPSRVSLPGPFAPADKPEEIPEPSASGGAAHKWAIEGISPKRRAASPVARAIGAFAFAMACHRRSGVGCLGPRGSRPRCPSRAAASPKRWGRPAARIGHARHPVGKCGGHGPRTDDRAPRTRRTGPDRSPDPASSGVRCRRRELDRDRTARGAVCFRAPSGPRRARDRLEGLGSCGGSTRSGLLNQRGARMRGAGFVGSSGHEWRG